MVLENVFIISLMVIIPSSYLDVIYFMDLFYYSETVVYCIT